MTSIHDFHSSKTNRRFGPKAWSRGQSVLPKADHLQLQRHLELCERLQQPAWRLLACVLHNKIMTSEPVANLYARNLVTGGCCVTYSVCGGPGLTGVLVHRTTLDSGSSVIPVVSLLGATLIGMRVGQRAPLLCEDGTIMSLSVLEVSMPN